MDEFRTFEESLLRPEVRRSPEALGARISDDFVEFGSSGRVFSKRDVLNAADHLPDIVLPLQDFSATRVSPRVTLVRYRSTMRQSDGSTTEALRCSVWVRREGRWQIVFHQGTSVA